METNIQTGLTDLQVQERLAQFGPNTVKKEIGRSFLKIFISQFNNPLVYLLFISGIIIFFAGAQFDAYIIAGILLLNAIIGSFQDIRIAIVVEKLRRFEKSNAIVIRNGIRKVIDTKLLVQGDLLILQEGEKIPADAKLIEVYNLSVDESLLTGESHPVQKGINDTILAGSYVRSGYGKALVTETGTRTRLGQIHRTMETVSTDMPLQKDLTRLLRFVLGVIVAICFSLLFIGVATGRPFGQLLAALTALFICVLPQGLPVIMTVVLVSGAYTLARKKVFAKKLQAVEALGRSDVIVIDKTGTLTRNELMVSMVVAAERLFTVTGFGYLQEGAVAQDGKTITAKDSPQSLKLMAYAALLLDHSEIKQQGQKITIKGSPLEAAMRIFAQKLGLEKSELSTEYKIVYEIPFSSEYKYHAGFLEHNGKGLLFVLGAPEIIIKKCASVSDFYKQELEKLLKQGLRVVAVAFKEFDLELLKITDHIELKSSLKDLEFLGLYGLNDALRKEAADIIRILQKAGTRIVMATGDNHETALHLATQSGILQKEHTGMEATEFQKFSDKELSQKLSTVTVFSRVLPEDKLRLVKLYQEQGNIVAMVGDGANDAPALSMAQLGIAMGNAGSDVAQQASDIILLDDSFESLIVGVSQGRHIFTSFKRVILYFFTTNFSEIGIILLAFGFNLPLPLLASQILWLNFITDGLLDFSLAMESGTGSFLHPYWLKGHPTLIDSQLVMRIIYQSSLVVAATFFFFYKYHIVDITLARTLVMVVLTICYWFLALNCRSFNHSIFKIGLFSNRWLFVSLLIIPALLLGILYTSWGNLIFQTVPLSWSHWRLIIPIGCSLLIIEELRKRIVRGN